MRVDARVLHVLGQVADGRARVAGRAGQLKVDPPDEQVLLAHLEQRAHTLVLGLERDQARVRAQVDGGEEADLADWES